jgi:hypothetical protein
MKWRATCGGDVSEKRRAGQRGAWEPGPKLDTDATRPEEFMHSCLGWVESGWCVGGQRQLTWLCQVGRRLKHGASVVGVAGRKQVRRVQSGAVRTDSQREGGYVRYAMG